jgi:hypothetical protein
VRAAMSAVQAWIFVAGGAVGVCECLFPPWVTVVCYGAGSQVVRRFLFNATAIPGRNIWHVDIDQLATHLLAIFVISTILYGVVGAMGRHEHKRT